MVRKLHGEGIIQKKLYKKKTTRKRDYIKRRLYQKKTIQRIIQKEDKYKEGIIQRKDYIKEII